MTRRVTEPLPDFMQWESVAALVGSRRTRSLAAYPSTEDQCRETLAFCRRNGLTVCPRGSGHSYGDLPLNDGHVLLKTERMNRILAFDEESGLMTVEPGVRIIDVYKRAHDRLFALPASPTEAAITVAGAIAANVHGKDSWRAGNFGDQVVSLRLLTATGRIIRADRTVHRDVFDAVIGGLGMLGVILEATIRLKRVPSPWLEISRTPVGGIRELFEHLERVEAASDFAVAWLDMSARGGRLGRGVIHATRWISRESPAGRLQEEVAEGFRRLERRRGQAAALYGTVDSVISAALHAQRTTVRFFNSLYHVYCRLRRRLGTADNVELFLRYNFDASFTVPPVSIMCGPCGYTIQVSVPRREAPAAIAAMIRIWQGSPCPPVTTIMRIHRRDGHLISFCEDGYSLTFELHPTKGHEARMRSVVDELLECVMAHGGKAYLAKDMVLTRQQFRRMYPEHAAFLRMKRRLDPDELFASDLYRRLIRATEAPHPARAPETPEIHVETAGARLRDFARGLSSGHAPRP